MDQYKSHMSERGIKQVDSEEDEVEFVVDEYEIEDGETINVLNRFDRQRYNL